MTASFPSAAHSVASASAARGVDNVRSTVSSSSIVPDKTKMRMRKEVVLCLMLLTALVCLRFPFPLTFSSNKTKYHMLERHWDGYFTVARQRIYCKRYQPDEKRRYRAC